MLNRSTIILVLLAVVALANAQTSKTPINNGILQSNLDAASFKILSANLVDYAGTGMSWNVSTNKFDVTGGGGSVDDTAFASSWNGVTTTAPSKNAVYDWGHTFDTNDNGKVNVLDMGAGMVKTDAAGAVSAATAGVEYLPPTAISDVAFASSWDTVTQQAPSRNAVYDWGHTFDTDDDGKVNVLDLAAGIPKTNASGVLSLAVAGTDYEPPLGNPGTNGYVLSSTTGGTRSWVAQSGGGGTPGGSSKDFQWNNAGAFGGGTGFTYENGAPNVWQFQKNQAARSSVYAKNINSAGDTGFTAINDLSNVFYFGFSGSTFTPYGAWGANNGIVYSNQDFAIIADNAGSIRFAAAGPVSSMMLTGSGNNAELFLGSSNDTALRRNASGVVEVNNGTALNYRDLVLRQLFVYGGITLTPTGLPSNVVSSYGVVTSTIDQTAATDTAHLTYTVPANVCTVGTTFRITAWGNMDNGTTAITFTPKIRWGGTGGSLMIAAPTVVSTTTVATVRSWRADAIVTIRSIGASGTAVADLVLHNHTSNLSADTVDEATTGASGVTVDTTTNKDLVFVWAMNLTTGTPHVRTIGGIIEMVKN